MLKATDVPIAIMRGKPILKLVIPDPGVVAQTLKQRPICSRCAIRQLGLELADRQASFSVPQRS